jgi:hypothetical protein
MSLIQDVYKLILSKTAKEDWPAICRVCKKFNELMATVKKAYFLKKVPHEMFLPAEFKFQSFTTDREHKIIKPIFNYPVEIDACGFRRGYGGMSIIFKFIFPDVKFEYGCCFDGKSEDQMTISSTNEIYDYILFECIHTREKITKFKNYENEAYGSYLMLEINDKKFLITNFNNNNYFIPDDYMHDMETFTNINDWHKQHPYDLPVIKVLKKMFT